MMKFLSSGAWQGIGAIVSILALLFALYVFTVEQQSNTPTSTIVEQPHNQQEIGLGISSDPQVLDNIIVLNIKKNLIIVILLHTIFFLVILFLFPKTRLISFNAIVIITSILIYINSIIIFSGVDIEWMSIPLLARFKYVGVIMIVPAVLIIGGAITSSYMTKKRSA
jgi:hypothetical protein